MFLRTIERYKNGKKHRYWSVVENRRVAAKRVVQKTLLYLGEINDSQQSQWIHAIEMIEDDKKYQFALFTEDRQPPAECDSIRPIYHQLESRIESHIFVSFLAYCLHVTLGQRLQGSAPGLTPRSVLEQMKGIQMLDVEVPTTDGRTLKMTRYTQPDKTQQLLLTQLGLQLPQQAPPKITAVFMG